ncbi:putative RNA-directed DNA polymerase [Helianthus annuus]|uniref:RNA-directed DNA polymerase n=1 Tax=Helianthus annuus TaxID=4232 RepID=A0A9K3HSR7_HELAN|nr:putative RNA-directed DNA polymerase [Helianthus annuus]
MATVKNARASVLVNGSPTQEFECYRGLRQGDPLSPFLFIITMEALTGVMKKACSLGLYEGVRFVNHGSVLSHFFYADDVIFVGRWTEYSVRNLRRILRCFFLASGLRVSLAKSSVYGVNVGDENVQNMANTLGCKVGRFPFKHLGLQVGANMNLVKNWQPVVDIFKKRLAIWKAKILSFGGRLTLIKSVLNALPTYYFSLYRAPTRVIEQLERLRREFLWGITPESGKLNMVAWDSVMTPKELGGVGVGSLKDANLAMLAKWWWRFKTDPDSLWRKVIWSIHHSERAWNPIPGKMSIAGPWKQVFKVSGDLEKYGLKLADCFRAKPGVGVEISFWKEKWTEGDSLQVRYPELFELERAKNVTVADRVKVIDGTVVLNFCWIRMPSTPEEVMAVQLLSDEMFAAARGYGDDRWTWELDGSGNFSVKSLKNYLQCARFPNLGNDFSWNNWTPSKVNFLSWRISLDRLPTLVALARRNVINGQIECKMCGLFAEDVDHLFAGCNGAQYVWDFISHWCKISSIYAFCAKDLLKWHMQVRGNAKWKQLIYAVIQVALWVIWRSRNDLVFNNKAVNRVRMTTEIKQLSFLWVGNRSSLKGISWEDWCMFDIARKCL